MAEEYKRYIVRWHDFENGLRTQEFEVKTRAIKFAQEKAKTERWLFEVIDKLYGKVLSQHQSKQEKKTVATIQQKIQSELLRLGLASTDADYGQGGGIDVDFQFTTDTDKVRVCDAQVCDTYNAEKLLKKLQRASEMTAETFWLTAETEDTTEFLVSRIGSNSANQSMCDKMPLLLLDAENKEEASKEFFSIWADSFTIYANQSIHIEDAEDITGEEYDELQETDHNNRKLIREGYVL